MIIVSTAAHAVEMPEPYTLVRKLRAAEDRIVAGDAAAVAERQRQLLEAGSALASATRQAWLDGRNVRALLVWTLAGGEWKLLERLAAEGRLDASRSLVDLVLAVAKAERAKAVRAFDAVDVDSLDLTLLAALALATSDRLGHELQARAQSLLERVAARMPGTFFAEAAQRRLIAEHFRRGADGQARQLMLDYFRRFPASLLAAQLTEQLVQIAGSAGPVGDGRLVGLLSAWPDDARTPKASELLRITRSSLIAGRLHLSEALASMSAGRAVSQIERTKARLYLAAALAPQGRKLDLPGTAEIAALDASDRALHAGVLMLAARVGEVRRELGSQAPQPVADVVGRGRAAIENALKEAAR